MKNITGLRPPRCQPPKASTQAATSPQAAAQARGKTGRPARPAEVKMPRSSPLSNSAGLRRSCLCRARYIAVTAAAVPAAAPATMLTGLGWKVILAEATASDQRPARLQSITLA